MHRDSVLRFLHVSDLRLGQVVHGVGYVARQFREKLLAAPWEAAIACFDQAIAHQVDFVLLNGDNVPEGIEQNRALAFLCEQFERLAEHGIQVFWRSETSSLESWRRCFEWPSNVCEMTPRSGAVTFGRGGESLAVVSADSVPETEFFTVALTDHSGSTLSADYTACSGVERTDSVVAGRTMHSPGSPQGRSFAESGVRGCSLIELDRNNSVTIGFVETNSVVWDVVPITLSSAVDLDATLTQRLIQLDGRSTRLISLVLDASDTATALALETTNLKSLLDRLNRSLLSRDVCVANIELGADLTVAPAAMRDGCVREFCEIVHGRGEQSLQQLRSRNSVLAGSPTARVLSETTRLGAELLS